MRKCLHVLSMDKLSGAEKLVLILCKNMKEYQPIVVCGGNNLKSIFEKENIISYSINFSTNSILKNIKELRQIIKDQDIRLIHAHDNNASIISYLAKTLYKLDIKLISHIHNCYPWLEGDTKLKKVDTFFRKRYDYNITCGNLVYEYYKKNTEYINEKNTISLSNAIDIDKIKNNMTKNMDDVYEEFNIPKGKTILGFIGRLSQQKGIIPFIKELRKHKDKFDKCKFLLVGSGEQEEEVRNLLKEYNLEELFILTGYQNDVYKFYPIIDIFFLPSIYEGLPMVILEAMSFSKPVVAMDVGSINEVIKHEKNGILVPKQNYSMFIQQLINISENRNIADRYGKEAFKEIETNYNIKKYEKEISKLYDDILINEN